MPNGEKMIFLERNPKIFRKMLKYIRSYGKMDLKPLQDSDDYQLFVTELENWGIDM